MQKKNPNVAAVLGLVFGPLGYLYIGWRYSVMAFAVLFLYVVVAALAGFSLPEWMQYITLPIFAWKAFTICSVRNSLIETGDEQANMVDTFPIAAMAMSDLLVGVGMITAGALGVYASGLMFFDGRIFRALGMLFIGTPVLMWLATLVFGSVAAGIDAVFLCGGANVFRRSSALGEAR